MSSSGEGLPTVQHNTGSKILPTSTASREPADTTENGPKSNTHLELIPTEHPEISWNDSCNTTVRGSDSGFLDIGSHKQPRLFPPPNEVDEIGLNDAPEVPTPQTPVPDEKSQDNDFPLQRHRGALSETVRKLQNSCSVMLETRLEAHKRRSIIRRDRKVLGDLDARFIQELRNILYTSPNEKLEALLGLCEEMQTLRDEFLPKEDDYNLIEDRLITEEFELQETGEKLLSILDRVRNSSVGGSELSSRLEEDFTQVNRAASLGSATQRPETLEYLSRLGDRDIVIERLSELRHERATLVEEEKSKARVKMVLSEEARKFLDTFDVRHEKLQQELAVVDADLARLSKTLERTDKIFFTSTRFEDLDDITGSDADEVRHSYLNSLPSVISSSDLTLPSAARAPSTPEANKPDRPQRDALLLPEDHTAPTFNRFPRTDRNSLTSMHRINAWLLDQQGTMSADAFINDWLLNILRSSVLEVYHYKSAKDLQTVQISQEGLRDLVLEWWSSDKAAGEYLRTLRLEARGISLSARADRSNYDVHSDMVVVTLNQLSDRLYRDCTLQQVGGNVRLTVRRTRSI
jgi:hypothetical protein